jgi:carbonic anhydrase
MSALESFKDLTMNRLLQLIALLLIPCQFAFAGEPAVHWSYEGDDGPEHWGDLSPDYNFCREGSNQSPVDLVADLHVELPELVFQYHGTALREVHDGHTIRVDIEPGSYLEIPELNVRSELKQAHFHSPSEHTVNGKYFAMEFHMVHIHHDGHITVVGLMIQEGEETPLLTKLWSFMPEKEGERTEAPLTVFQSGVMPPTRNYFSYNGSLTTPPCSEGVRWVVLRDPLTASAEQIERFKARVGLSTNRPVQPRHSRLILD